MATSKRSFPAPAKFEAYALVLAFGSLGCGSKTELVIGGDTTAAICMNVQAPPATSLVHRYSFSDIGTTVGDSISGANGQTAATIAGGVPGVPGSGAPLDGSGQLALDGTTGYVDLPNGIVSSLGDATFMVWTEWRGAAAYQRVFDFGTSTAGEGKRDQCKSCVLLMTASGDSRGQGLCAQVHAPSIGATEQIVTNQYLDKNFRQVALVFKSNDSMSLYLDGALIGATPITVALSEIMDNNNWLGLSQFNQDSTYQGDYEEFRIYDRALSACEVADTVVNGPDQP
jgi:hypothetical protein